MIKQKIVLLLVTVFVFSWGSHRANAGVIVDTFGLGLSHGASGLELFDPNAPDIYTYFVTGQVFRTPTYSTSLTRAIVPFLMDDPTANVAPVPMSIWTVIDGGGGM